MLLTTIRHWENDKVIYSYHGNVVWINQHLGEFVFEGSGTKFWGKTDYWEVIQQPLPIVGKIIVTNN